MNGELLKLFGVLLTVAGVIVECAGLVSTRWLQLPRAFTILAIGLLLWFAGLGMLIAAGFLGR